MGRHRHLRALLLSFAIACKSTGGAPASAAGPTAGPAEPATTNGVEAGPSENEPEELQVRATEECQAAAALLDTDDASGALVRIDRCYALMAELPEEPEETFTQAKQDLRLLVAELVQRAYRQTPAAQPAAMASWDLGLPLVDNEYVRREIKSFTTYERNAFLDAYRRSGRYRPMILAKLAAAGLPSQLSWLPMVESWFEVGALSRIGALGPWQFIASTGLRYGLKRDRWVDERLDPEKATDAAVAYLADLHRQFGDWPKALAAYNCGEGRLHALQDRSAASYQDFWDLYVQLPEETRRYVPRLIAAIQIIEAPERFGVTLPEPEAPAADTVTVAVERPVRLDALEKSLGLSAGAISALNPELRWAATPASAYPLRVPAPYADQVVTAATALPQYQPDNVEYVVHRVRPGETLSEIAERYHTSVTAILKVNRLRSAHRIFPRQRLLIPSRN